MGEAVRAGHDGLTFRCGSLHFFYSLDFVRWLSHREMLILDYEGKTVSSG